MLPAHWTSSVVGVSFQPDYPANLHRLHARMLAAPPGAPPPLVALTREPANPYDANAVAVDVVGYGRVGHLPRAAAARVAPDLDMGGRWHAEIAEVVDGVHPTVTVRFRRVAEPAAQEAAV